MTLTRMELAAALQGLPEKIEAAEHELLVAETFRIDCFQALEAEKHRLLLGGLIDGKNAEIRDAQLAQMTEASLASLTAADRDVLYHKQKLRCVMARFASLRALTRLLSTEGTSDE